MWTFLIVAVSCIFVLAIVKMSLEFSERIERIKHGYPLDGDDKVSEKKTDKEYVDVRGEEKLQ